MWLTNVPMDSSYDRTYLSMIDHIGRYPYLTTLRGTATLVKTCTYVVLIYEISTSHYK